MECSSPKESADGKEATVEMYCQTNHEIASKNNTDSSGQDDEKSADILTTGRRVRRRASAHYIARPGFNGILPGNPRSVHLKTAVTLGVVTDVATDGVPVLLACQRQCIDILRVGLSVGAAVYSDQINI